MNYFFIWDSYNKSFLIANSEPLFLAQRILDVHCLHQKTLIINILKLLLKNQELYQRVLFMISIQG
jgi:hypothetical protein